MGYSRQQSKHHRRRASKNHNMKGYHNTDCYDHQQYPHPAEVKSKARQAGNKAAPYIITAVFIGGCIWLIITAFL